MFIRHLYVYISALCFFLVGNVFITTHESDWRQVAMAQPDGEYVMILRAPYDDTTGKTIALYR